jgi:hypothetical protein
MIIQGSSIKQMSRIGVTAKITIVAIDLIEYTIGGKRKGIG